MEVLTACRPGNCRQRLALIDAVSGQVREVMAQRAAQGVAADRARPGSLRSEKKPWKAVFFLRSALVFYCSHPLRPPLARHSLPAPNCRFDSGSSIEADWNYARHWKVAVGD
ncbi:MAG: hypothetical protein RLZZ385_107 [Pseudomonadota bacterium]